MKPGVADLEGSSLFHWELVKKGNERILGRYRGSALMDFNVHLSVAAVTLQSKPLVVVPPADCR